jgi:hypothetical protein
MPDCDDVNQECFVPNTEEDAVVPDSNPPEVVGSGEFSASWRTRVLAERFYAAQYPIRDAWGNALQFLAGRTGEEDLVPTHGPVAVGGDGDGL